MKHSISPLILLLLLCACSGGRDPIPYLNQWNVKHYSTDGFDHCKGYGCRLIDHVTLTQQQWAQIDSHFIPPSVSAADERNKLEKVIGEFERIVGPITNTHTDIKDTFYRLGDDQLDCVDESVNTTTYLLLLQERKHIRFHNIHGPTARPPFVAGAKWPHQAALIEDKQNKQKFVVDSWFEDSGYNAYVVNADEWFYNWSPRKAGRERSR